MSITLGRPNVQAGGTGSALDIGQTRRDLLNL